jgi:predicted RNA-binding Zn-ribbon protein involved in translation (DUF1610 family)
MVEYEGKTYERDSRSKYRCNGGCSDPNYPPRSWTSDAGFLKHLGECKGKPEAELTWSPIAPQEREKFADCPDCLKPIWKMTTCWWMHDRIVCPDCYRPYFDAGKGHWDAAGLELPLFSLEI